VFLRGATAIAVVGSAIAVLVPGRVGQAAGAAVVATLVAAPLLRVLWLAVRWVRRGDLLFAGVAGVLLVIVGAAALVV
jgi:hypothetical protein